MPDTRSMSLEDELIRSSIRSDAALETALRWIQGSPWVEHPSQELPTSSARATHDEDPITMATGSSTAGAQQGGGPLNSPRGTSSHRQLLMHAVHALVEGRMRPASTHPPPPASYRSPPRAAQQHSGYSRGQQGGASQSQAGVSSSSSAAPARGMTEFLTPQSAPAGHSHPLTHATGLGTPSTNAVPGGGGGGGASAGGSERGSGGAWGGVPRRRHEVRHGFSELFIYLRFLMEHPPPLISVIIPLPVSHVPHCDL